MMLLLMNSTHLGSKWKRGYSQMVYYVRVQMAIAVVRANSLLIRGSHDQQQPRHPLIPSTPSRSFPSLIPIPTP